MITGVSGSVWSIYMHCQMISVIQTRCIEKRCLNASQGTHVVCFNRYTYRVVNTPLVSSVSVRYFGTSTSLSIHNWY